MATSVNDQVLQPDVAHDCGHMASVPAQVRNPIEAVRNDLVAGTPPSIAGCGSFASASGAQARR